MKILIEFGNNLLEAVKNVGHTETPGRDLREAFGIDVGHIVACSLLSANLNPDKNVNITIDLSNITDYI